MDKELERKIREEAALWLYRVPIAELTSIERNRVQYLYEFAKKILEKYGAEGGT